MHIINSNKIRSLLEFFIKNPGDNLNKFWLGYEYEKIGHMSSAMGYYLSCAENSDSDLLAYECLIRKAICFRSQGEREIHVRNSLLLAVSLMPERPEAYYLLSQAYEISKDLRDEDKWQQAYAWARIGERITKKFEVAPLLTKTPYHGDYLFSFQQAVSLWWIGRASESLKLFTQLKNNKELDDRHKECVNYNLETLAMKQPTLNT
jgi:tetratricopeptide (TPR) repeat protein